jgi:Holliday junction resolvase
VNTKAKGTKNEHRSMTILEAAGYACTRSGASLGVFDIVGIGPTDVVLLQVKSNRWPSEVEMESIKNFPCPPICKRLVHRWRDRQRLPDVKEIT